MLITFNLQHIYSNSDEIFIAPSGVQKERMHPDDLFIQTIDGADIVVPPEFRKYGALQYKYLQAILYKYRL